MENRFGKLLIYFGLALILIGIVVWVLGLFLPIGKLPGDIHYQGDKTVFYFPIVSALLISVILTVIVNVIIWLLRK